MEKKINKLKEVGKISSHLEISSEIGMDKGNLSSRILGYYGGAIGGLMTRKLIERGEKDLINEYKNK